MTWDLWYALMSCTEQLKKKRLGSGQIDWLVGQNETRKSLSFCQLSTLIFVCVCVNGELYEDGELIPRSVYCCLLFSLFSFLFSPQVKILYSKMTIQFCTSTVNLSYSNFCDLYLSFMFIHVDFSSLNSKIAKSICETLILQSINF